MVSFSRMQEALGHEALNFPNLLLFQKPNTSHSLVDSSHLLKDLLQLEIPMNKLFKMSQMDHQKHIFILSNQSTPIILLFY
jgi:hypothetical protein